MAIKTAKEKFDDERVDLESWDRSTLGDDEHLTSVVVQLGPLAKALEEITLEMEFDRSQMQALAWAFKDILQRYQADMMNAAELYDKAREEAKKGGSHEVSR